MNQIRICTHGLNGVYSHHCSSNCCAHNVMTSWRCTALVHRISISYLRSCTTICNVLPNTYTHTHTQACQIYYLIVRCNCKCASSLQLPPFNMHGMRLARHECGGFPNGMCAGWRWPGRVAHNEIVYKVSHSLEPVVDASWYFREDFQ